MSIAYLTPVYPAPSLTFIRREIAAIESRGLVVHRFAMRRFAGKLVDEKDIAEQRQTAFLLEAGAPALSSSLLLDSADSAQAMVSRSHHGCEIRPTFGTRPDSTPDLSGRGMQSAPAVSGVRRPAFARSFR